MEQKIVYFAVDDVGDPIAILACGHPQHVRHNPPLENRPWVLTEIGRISRIGQTLNCLRCEDPEDDSTLFPVEVENEKDSNSSILNEYQAGKNE